MGFGYQVSKTKHDYYQGSLVDLHTQDYKSLCAAVTICANLVNTQIHTDRQTAFDQLV